MERLSRTERRAVQSERDPVKREEGYQVEFDCCRACNHLFNVYQDEEGPAKNCPRCGWNRHVMGGNCG